MTDPLEFLTSIYGGDRPVAPPPLPPSSLQLRRPYVTLTFAQSLDAKIAGADGMQLILSCKESMVMTHWMRAMHDGVLIGIGTAMNDDPQLNTRHLPERASKEYGSPRPIVLDTNLRISVDCKMIKNFREGKGRRPWIVCSNRMQDSARKEEVEMAGARVISVEGSAERGLNMRTVLEMLEKNGIERLMVEGGAKVIQTFLEGAGRLVDTVIVTVAPRIVGGEGVGYACSAVETGEYIRTAQIGRDSVVGLSIR